MKYNKQLRSFLFIAVALLCSTHIFGQGSTRQVLFDDGWRFSRGGIMGAERANFDDSKWKVVNLPHDWSIEDLPGTQSPFDQQAVGQASTGFTVGGTGWYRKRMDVPASYEGKRIVLEFEGAYMNTEVYINEKLVRSHPYGYTPFWIDITNFLKYGGSNQLSVRVMNEGSNTRWYSGSGIYRHVWLKVLEPVHVAQWGVSVTTPQITGSEAVVNIETNIQNESAGERKVSLIHILKTPAGTEAGVKEETAILKPGEQRLTGSIKVSNPQLWSPDSPSLYTLITRVFSEGQLSDEVETVVGIRSIAYDAKQGFLLNGKSIKLKGGCIHHDNGPVGSRAFDRAEERKVELLKASGYNAMRSAHNPASPALLRACDRLGILVIDEAFDMWRDGKNPFDYSLHFDRFWKQDVAAMIYQARNHPSVVIWSIGNEIPNMDSREVADIAKTLADFCRELDPTRPVTAAVNSVTDEKDAFFSALDIAGYNYAPQRYATDRKRVPSRVIVSTESSPFFAYDYWQGVMNDPGVIGDFVWTAFDYIGEASLGHRGYPYDEHVYPWTLAYSGDIDICGWKRPQSYYRDILWSAKDQISIFVRPPSPSFPVNPNKAEWSNWHWHDVVPDWNWSGMTGTSLEVQVYSTAPQVELFLNGKSLGKKENGHQQQFITVWKVPYREGVLKAAGIRGRKEIVSAQLSTAGSPEIIVLRPDRSQLKADGQDLSYITIELHDNAGLINPKAENLLKFEVSGPADIAAVSNANPVSLESYTQPMRKAWRGKCMLVLRTKKEAGEIKLKVSSAGLPVAEASLIAR